MEVYLDEFALNDATNLMYLDENIEGVAGLPNIRTSSGNNTGRDGAWVSRQLYEGRFMSFKGRIFGGDNLQVELKRQELASILRRKKLTLTIVTYGGQKFVTQVNVMANQMPITWQQNIVQWKIDLLSEDPLFYDNSSGELIAMLGKTKEGGFDIPFNIPLDISAGTPPTTVNNAGNETVYPIIRIETKATNPQLINRSTNAFMGVEIAMLDGDVLEIDMKNKTVTYNGLNIYGLQMVGSSFWGLAAGDNILELITDIGSEATVAEIQYQSGFIGI